MPTDYFVPGKAETTGDAQDASEETEEQQKERLDRLYQKAVKATALINRAHAPKQKQVSK